MSIFPTKDLRLELKFVSRDYNYDLIYSWLKFHNYNFQKEYEDRIINNIYFDTLSLTSFEANIKEFSKRFKVRFRWFDNFNNKKNGNLEIKSKDNIYGWKDRFPVNKIEVSENKSWKEISKRIINGVPNNIKILLKEYSVPVIINQYCRKYFVTSDGKFRVTIDRNQKNYDQLNRSKPNLSKNCELSDNLVLEVKFNKEEETQLQNLLSEIPIKYSKNSKYVNAVKNSYGL